MVVEDGPSVVREHFVGKCSNERWVKLKHGESQLTRVTQIHGRFDNKIGLETECSS